MNTLGFLFNIDYEAHDEDDGDFIELCYFDSSQNAVTLNLSKWRSFYVKKLQEIISSDILYVEQLKENLCPIGELGKPVAIRPNSLKLHNENELAQHVVENVRDYVLNNKERNPELKFEEFVVKIKWDQTISTFIEIKNKEL